MGRTGDPKIKKIKKSKKNQAKIKKTLGLSPKRKRPLFNGPIECRLFEIPLTRGVYRPRANGELSADPITEKPEGGNSTED